MSPVKYTHAELKGNGSNEKKFRRKELPPDRQFSDTRKLMKVRRRLDEYNKIATQVNSLVENIENGHEGTKAIAEWAKKNRESLSANAHPMLKFLVRAYDLNDTKFREMHTNFVALSEIIGKMSDGAHVENPEVLNEAITCGKEVARLGEVLVQTGDEFQRRVGILQRRMTAAN